MAENDQQQDDIVYETEETKSKKTASDDVVLEDENGAPEDRIKKLKDQIKTLQQEKQEYMDGWQRERADFTNYKKRIENEKVEVIKYANENLLEELLPVLNSFEMAFANKEAWEKVDKNWRIGVEYIYSQLLKTLADNGITEMNPVGETFDPKFHVADGHEETIDHFQEGKIATVKKKGYMLADRVIVAPTVTVFELKK